MNMKSIRIAYAVNHTGLFEEKHFGYADKYLIYEWVNNEFLLIREEINDFNDFNEDELEASVKSCGSIMDMLKFHEVKVLVSRQFGKNIHMVNNFFIPVKVNSEMPGEVAEILKKHIRWVEDELSTRTEDFKLFSLNRGVLKTSISKLSVNLFLLPEEFMNPQVNYRNHKKGKYQ